VLPYLRRHATSSIKIQTITPGVCSSVALAGFALTECSGSSSRVYPALEGLTAVVNSCDLFRLRPGFDPLCVRLSPQRCLTCSWACRMSSGPWGIVPDTPRKSKKKKFKQYKRLGNWINTPKPKRSARVLKKKMGKKPAIND